MAVANCVTVGRLLSYSEPQVLCLKHEDKSNRKGAENMERQFIEYKWPRDVENTFKFPARYNED